MEKKYKNILSMDSYWFKKDERKKRASRKICVEIGVEIGSNDIVWCHVSLRI